MRIALLVILVFGNNMKFCKNCGKELVKPENPQIRNYSYCNVTCRRKKYYRDNGGAQFQRDYLYKKNGGESEEKIQCLICGLWYRQVGSHIVQVHKITAREYREVMKLEVKRGLTRGWYRELKGEQALENGTVDNLLKGAKFRFKKGDKVPVYERSKETLEKLARARGARIGH